MVLTRFARAGGRVVAALALPFVFAAATATCFGATEVKLVVTTDLTCDAKPRTSIQAGATTSGEGSVAETTECNLGAAGEAFIGSLTLVPSGSRSAHMGVRVALALPPKAPEDCTVASPDNCIVATRSLAFIKHSARELPIRLYKNCLGVVCSDPSTSCKQHVCVPNDPENFKDPEPGDASTADAPVAPDAGGDAAAPTACQGPRGDGVLSTIGPPTHLAATGTTLVWSTDDAATGKSTVFSLPKQPALNEGAKPLLIEGSVTALTANATRAAFATESSFGLPAVHLVVDIANPALPLTLPYPTTSLAFGPDGALYIASNDHVFSNRGGGPSPTQLLTTGGGAIATSDSSIFVLWTPTTPSTLTGFLLLNPGGQTQTVSDTASALASNSTAAFAAIAPAAGKLPDIMDLNPLSAPVVASASGPVAELAVSATEVFWIETVDPNQTRIMRAPYPASSMKAVPKLVVGGYRSIRGLAVDRSADGCVYFWGEPISTGQPAAVRVAPKTP